MQEQTVFKKMKIFKKQDLSNSKYLSDNGFYLPSGLGITNKELNYVVKALFKILKNIN